MGWAFLSTTIDVAPASERNINRGNCWKIFHTKDLKTSHVRTYNTAGFGKINAK